MIPATILYTIVQPVYIYRIFMISVNKRKLSENISDHDTFLQSNYLQLSCYKRQEKVLHHLIKIETNKIYIYILYLYIILLDNQSARYEIAEQYI